VTPAQATGHPTFDDFGPGGPTNSGDRAADCWYANHALPARPACSDCDGVIPPWAKRSNGLLGERISLGGQDVVGFGNVGVGETKLATPGSIWKFVIQTSIPLNATSCAAAEQSYRAGVQATGASVLNFVCPDGSDKISTTVLYGGTQSYPVTVGIPVSIGGQTVTVVSAEQIQPGPTEPTGLEKPSGLSTGAVVGITAVGAVVVGGVTYLIARRA